MNINQIFIWFLENTNLQKIHVNMSGHFGQFLLAAVMQVMLHLILWKQWTKKNFVFWFNIAFWWRKTVQTEEWPEKHYSASLLRKHPFVYGLENLNVTVHVLKLKHQFEKKKKSPYCFWWLRNESERDDKHRKDVRNILHKHLHIKKLWVRLMPCFLSSDHKQQWANDSEHGLELFSVIQMSFCIIRNNEWKMDL